MTRYLDLAECFCLAEQAMLAVAARDVDEAWLASWLRDRVRFG